MSLVDRLHPFLAMRLEDGIDDITKIAEKEGFTVSILDQSFPKNIDYNSKRLNICTAEDKDGLACIHRFTIG